MKVFVEKQRKTIDLKFNGDVKFLLKKLGINPKEVIVVVNDELVGEDETIKDSDNIKVLSVVSGG